MVEHNSQLVWIEDDTDRIKPSIPEELAERVKEEADNMRSSMTQSLIVGAAVQNYADNDELSRVEAFLDELLRDEGVPPEFLKSTQNKKSVSEWQADEKYYMQAQLPVGIIGMVEDNAPSTKRKGWWVTNALIEYLDSPYETRFERIETKRQVLTLLDGGEVPDEEMTRVIKKIRSEHLFENAHERLYGEGSKLVTDVTSVDWRSTGKSELVLDGNQDLSQLVKTKDVRTEAMKAWARSLSGPLTFKSIDTITDEMNSDYATESTLHDIKESVWDFATQSDEVDVSDGEREQLVERLQLKCKKANKHPNTVLRKEISNASVPDLYRAVERL